MSGRKRSSRIADRRNEVAIRAQQGKADLTSLQLKATQAAMHPPSSRLAAEIPSSADASGKSPYNELEEPGGMRQ